MADGHLNKCKDCTRTDTRANTAARDPEERRRRDTVNMRRYWPTIDPRKRKARNAVNDAIRRRVLSTGTCEIGRDCEGRIEAHHEDYDRPLVLRWLCRKHHTAVEHYGLQLPLARF
jgi:hypothetical protein